MIRILIAEDQTLVRGALATLLNFEDDFEVVASAGDGEHALAQAMSLQPDIALIDIEMPKMSGLELVDRLRQDVPSCKSIIVTTFARPGYMQRAVKVGAKGYLLKDAQVDELASAIRGVMLGKRVMSPELMMEAMEQENPLTDRERETLQLAERGLCTRDIAKQLCLSEGTVRNYLSEAMSKLDVQTRHVAIRVARTQGWL